MWRERLKDWWKWHGREAWLALGFIIVAGLSFEAGLLHRSLSSTGPMIIHTGETVPAAGLPEKATTLIPPEMSKNVVSNVPTPEIHCAYVGSKNSNKYHLPTSRCAKQIKPANRVCFKDVAEATARGYVAGCLQ